MIWPRNTRPAVNDSGNDKGTLIACPQCGYDRAIIHAHITYPTGPGQGGMEQHTYAVNCPRCDGDTSTTLTR